MKKMVLANVNGLRKARIVSGRAALMLGCAMLPLAMASAAHAQTGETVLLEEGQLPQLVALGAGDDRLVVDIARVNASTGVLDLTGLVSGAVTDAGGEDSVWLRATTSQTRDVVFPMASGGTERQFVAADSTRFENTVYEASGNDTVLRLENRSRSTTSNILDMRYGPLRLAGDGTVVVAFAIQADGQVGSDQRAVRVEPGSTLSDQGNEGDGRLAVVVEADVGAIDTGGMIDVENAASLRLTNSARAQFRRGTGILGGTSDIILDANSWVNALDAASREVTLIRSSGRVFNSTKITIGGQFGSTNAQGTGVALTNGKLFNMLTENAAGNGVRSGGLGEIYGGRYGVIAEGGANLIENVGVIRAATGPAIQNVEGVLVTRNAIWQFTNGGGRAGEIHGGIRPTLAGAASAKLAYQSVGLATDVLVNSGLIDGNVQFGGGASMFLYTGATNGVDGQIDGGGGRDGYGKSFSANATHRLDNTILNQGNNSQFEMHGIELRGTDTVVTVTGDAEPLDAGLMLIGNGSLVNTANITADWGAWARDIEGIEGGLAFENRGEIRATELGYRAENNSRSLINRGLISADTAAAVRVVELRDGRSMPTYVFDNSGTIESAASGGSAASFYFDARGTNGDLGLFTNTGTIRQTGARERFGDDPRFALEITESNARDDRIWLDNGGTIEATGRGVSAVGLEGARFDIQNDGAMRTGGAGAGALRVRSALDSTQPRTSANLFNNGIISATGNAWTDDELGTAIGYGAIFDFRGSNGGEGFVSNSGTIEATGSGAVALAVKGNVDPQVRSTFILDNRGVVRGGASTSFGNVNDIEDFAVLSETTTLASAIHTRNTADEILNRGTVEGDVFLGELKDEFRNYGALRGNVGLGTGDDTYVTGSGATLTGVVDGGDGGDVIKVDLTGTDTKKIDASQFRNFELLTRYEGGAEKGNVSIFGTIDQALMRLRAISLRIDAGDTIRSADGARGYTFGHTGEATSETIENLGTIEGGVSMGGGADTLINRGTIGHDVDMGDGDDSVVNSGTITGNLSLGAGNDRYEAQGGGLVTGAIDGGDGSDTFVFRLNGNTGAIPGGFTNFESFGAYGPGTLGLALTQDYETIELHDGANLTLSEGTGTVGQILGDDSAQIVTIGDADFTGGVSLAGGDDTLGLQLNGALTGALDGGSGTDTLKLNLNGASSINDLSNFEIVDVAGSSPLTLTGTLGAGQQIKFDGSDNRFIVDTGAVFEGTANGGAGTDMLEINTGEANSRTIVAGQVTSFERLIAGGAGTLALNGQSYSFESVEVEGNLSIGDGASLASANGINFGTGDNRLTLDGTGTFASPVNGGDGTDTLAFNLGQGQSRNLSGIGAVTGFEQLAVAGAGTLNLDQDASYQRVSIEGGHLNVAGAATLTAPVLGGASNDRLTVSDGGKVAGDIALGGGDDIVINAGAINGDVLLGDGNDRYVARAGGVVTGTIDGGAGDNTFVFRLEGAQGSIPGSVVNFNSFGAYGPGTLTVNLDQGQQYANLELLEGASLVLAGNNGSVANVIGDDSGQSVKIDGALTGGVSLGGGDDSLTMTLSGLLQGALDGGAGTDTLNLTLAGASSIDGMFGFEIANITGTAPLTLTGDLGANQQVNFTGNTENELIIAAGTRFEGTVNGGGGHDLLRVRSGTAENRTVVASQIVSFEDLVSEGAGTLALTGSTYSFDSIAVNGGILELGSGTHLGTVNGIVFDGADNRLTIGAGAEVSGTIDGGAGNDTLALVQGAGAPRLLSLVQATGFERLESSGGELRIDRDATFENGVAIDASTVRVEAGRTLTANVTGGAGTETFTAFGTVIGNVDLGAGNDTLRIEGGRITGALIGGEGTDRLLFNTNGTYAAPTVFDGAASSGFELLEVAGGVVSMTGASSWTGMSITGGRLIGQAGSVISSTSTINVARGATFGSAGTVNGNIDVGGTLSPGASPGSMTVNGNVRFAAGSNLLLEVSPTASDLLNILGTLTIAEGAAMDITGVLHGTPGNRLDLVVAQGGITGRFTTINKSNDIFGFVVQNGNRLQIQSEFLNDSGYPSNVRASVDYANEVLRDGYGVQAFTSALPALVDAHGAIDQKAFAQLTPEVYGSVVQLGEENSLLVLDGVRSARAAQAGREKLFSFGQFVDGRADLDEQGGGNIGASSAHLTSRGLLGGVGYGFGDGTQVGVFVGGLEGKQTLRDLEAKSEANAFVAGVFANAQLGEVGLFGMVAINGGEVATKRSPIAAQGTAKAKYDLTSWAADLGVDYRVRFGSWAIAPKLGLSYVHTSRAVVAERGIGDLSLAVDRGSKDSWYGQAAIALSGSFDANGLKISPSAQLGLRQALGNREILTVGHYVGTDTAIAVNGVERSGSAVRVALGLGVDLNPRVRLQAGYSGEFAGTNRNSVTGGFSLRF